jgi:hypothetical protein
LAIAPFFHRVYNGATERGNMHVPW